jgi:hypothetical protein
VEAVVLEAQPSRKNWTRRTDVRACVRTKYAAVFFETEAWRQTGPWEHTRGPGAIRNGYIYVSCPAGPFV